MKIIYIVFIIFIFTSCSKSTSSNLQVSNMLQTQNAKHIKRNYENIINLILEYKTKIDKRNPKNFDEKLDPLLRENIKKSNNITLYSKNHKKLNYSYEYLNYAFEDKNIVNRNDYLIVGLYKLFFEIFQMKNTHKFTALGYDIKSFQRAYKNLQILNWKIKYKKDSKNDYMFLTWQNNWQIEYLQKINQNKRYKFNYDDIEYLVLKKESLEDPSNMSFEIIISNMLVFLNQSIKLLGAEPEELAVESIFSLAFLI